MVIEHLGLIIVQIPHNLVAVISGPHNEIFTVKNTGFVALSLEGPYEVVSIIDQTRLPVVIKEKGSDIILGYHHEVKMKTRTGPEKEQECVVAQLCVLSTFHGVVMS